MTSQPINVNPVLVQPNVDVVTPALNVAPGSGLFRVEATLVSPDWVAAGQPSTGTVRLQFQKDDLDGQGFITFSDATYSNNQHSHSGALPGVAEQWTDGKARKIRVIVTTSIAMRLGCSGQVVTAV